MRNLQLSVSVLLIMSLNTLIAQNGKFELKMSRVLQNDARWCWAATGEMIFNFQNTPKSSQCEVAQKYIEITPSFSINSCFCPTICNIQNSTNCGIAMSDVDFLKIFKSYEYNDWLIIRDWERDNEANWRKAKVLLNAFRPFIISHELLKSGSDRCTATHYLTAKGWCQRSDKCKFLLVNDPGACMGQNIIAINAFARSTFKICTALEDKNTVLIEANKTKVIQNAPTCDLFRCEEVIKDTPQLRSLMMISSKQQIMPPDEDSAFYKPIPVEYFEIINNKLIKVNENSIFDVPRRIPSNNDEYVINRVVQVDNVWETQMVLQAKYDSFRKIDPFVQIEENKFTLDKGLYTKGVLIPEYIDFYKFKFQKNWYYTINSDCVKCKPITHTEGQFINLHNILIKNIDEKGDNEKGDKVKDNKEKSDKVKDNKEKSDKMKDDKEKSDKVKDDKVKSDKVKDDKVKKRQSER